MAIPDNWNVNVVVCPVCDEPVIADVPLESNDPNVGVLIRHHIERRPGPVWEATRRYLPRRRGYHRRHVAWGGKRYCPQPRSRRSPRLLLGRHHQWQQHLRQRWPGHLLRVPLLRRRPVRHLSRPHPGHNVRRARGRQHRCAGLEQPKSRSILAVERYTGILREPHNRPKRLR